MGVSGRLNSIQWSCELSQHTHTHAMSRQPQPFTACNSRSGIPKRSPLVVTQGQGVNTPAVPYCDMGLGGDCLGISVHWLAGSCKQVLIEWEIRHDAANTTVKPLTDPALCC